MTDLAVLAIGFGLIPLASILLYSSRDWIVAHRDLACGGLLGVVAFLGLSHAMAFVLENKPFLFNGVSTFATASFLVFGLAFGGILGWFLFEGRFIRKESSRIVWAAVAFLALHSFGDGLVLGRDFVGGAFPPVPIDSLTVSGTVVHRLIEGAIVLVPALAVAWRRRSTFLVLFVSLASIPAAYTPGLLVDALGLVNGSAATLTLSTFFSSMEAILALVLIVRGFLPLATTGHGSRWLVWTVIGFIGLSLVHFLVE